MQVKLTGHEFEPLHIESGKRHDDRAWTYVGTGIHVTPVNRINGGLSQHDFFDTTTAKLKVEIAGGACDISLGKATVKVTLENCDEKTYGQVFAQDKVHGEYDVPAHVIFSRITSLQHATKGDRQFVMDMFDGVSRRVDLSLAEETVQHLEV